MNNTHIECLIDISGSMQGSIADVVYGYNKFLDEQRNNMIDDNTTWSLSFFNSMYKNMIYCQNIDTVPILNLKRYKKYNFELFQFHLLKYNKDYYHNNQKAVLFQ